MHQLLGPFSGHIMYDDISLFHHFSALWLIEHMLDGFVDPDW